MNRPHWRFYGTLAACFFGGSAVGGLLGWTLHGHPTLAALTLALVIVGGALAWRRWGSFGQRTAKR